MIATAFACRTWLRPSRSLYKRRARPARCPAFSAAALASLAWRSLRRRRRGWSTRPSPRIRLELKALNEDIHSHPEAGFQERRTAAKLTAALRAAGFGVTEHIGRMGVVVDDHFTGAAINDEALAVRTGAMLLRPAPEPEIARGSAASHGADPMDGRRRLRPLAAVSPRMAQKTRKPEVDIEVDGRSYMWRVQRQPVWSTDAAGWRGMALAVRDREGQRDAILEFPPAPPPRRGTPIVQPTQIPSHIVAKAVNSAIAAGWDPLSRGKTVTIVVDETGG